ncbi:MAG: nucleotidyltransferase domain-containing protein [Bilifractor sp.]|nr:nucleotidyltransferase domain-containing protein [Lachnospiraceae bacterium]MDY2837917.1 nucleotidyltransferase domain-containing protein [Bilifractor sp.]
MISPDLQKKIDSFNLGLDEILNCVVKICRKHDVDHVYLFGSYAAGTARPTSDIDIVIKGGRDLEGLREEIASIPTIKTIDLFMYDQDMNPYLREDIDRYAIELPMKK